MSDDSREWAGKTRLRSEEIGANQEAASQAEAAEDDALVRTQRSRSSTAPVASTTTARQTAACGPAAASHARLPDHRRLRETHQSLAGMVKDSGHRR